MAEPNRMAIEFEAPVRIESEMNRREHHMARYRRFKQQRHDVWLSWLDVGRKRHMIPRAVLAGGANLTVTLTRIAPRKITDEHENLRSGFKAVVDEIAKLVGLDDGDPRIRWEYRQEKGAPKQYAVRVRIEANGERNPS